MASTTKTVTWLDPSKDRKLEFKLENGVIKAKLFVKPSGHDNPDQFKYDLTEKDITIERYNPMELLRGLSQVVFRMDQLDLDQKDAILGSIKSRNIEVANRSPQSGYIVICALP